MGAAGEGSGGSVGTGSKKLKCIHCLCNIKQGKGTSCPGCSLIFCWRCEKKYFEECPNGDECVKPIRRCSKCADASNAFALLNEMDGIDGLPAKAKGQATIITKEIFAMLERRVQADDKLSMDFMPRVRCVGSADCRVQECYRCCIATHVSTRLESCVACRKTRCAPCRKSSDASREAALLAAHNVLIGRSLDFCKDDLLAVMPYLRLDEDSFAICRHCHVPYCFQSLDDRFARNVTAALLTSIASEIRGKDCPVYYLCSACYWSTKPCTNPTCPNETGVPTKRCGGCHLDRYCSAECQAAAYPDHMIR